MVHLKLFERIYQPLLPCLLKLNYHRLSTYSALYTEDHGLKNKNIHKFNQRWQFTNVESTSKYLLQKVIYDQDGVVIINKPPYLGSSKDDCSIYHSLPYLAEKLGHKYLKLVCVPEKAVSGVTILAAHDSIASRIKMALRRSKSVFTHNPHQKFVAVTVGHPLESEGCQRYGVSKQYKGKEKHCLIQRSWCQNAVKRREVNIGTISHKVLSKSEFTSLVSVSTWQARHHCPRIYLSDILLSPALGDQKFGQRVSSLFGKPILLKPWSAPAVKALPLPLLNKLHMRSGAEALIPLHFHLHELTLHRFFEDGCDLVLQAEPQDFFRWTCGQLGLELPETFKCQKSEHDANQVSKLDSNNLSQEYERLMESNPMLHPNWGNRKDGNSS